MTYIYELQVAEHARRRHLGSAFLAHAERAGRCESSGLMLTVDVRNEVAMNFYKQVHKFEESPLSPTWCAPTAKPEPKYQILQRIWDQEAHARLRLKGEEVLIAQYFD